MANDEKWIKVPNNKVRHVWVKALGDDCEIELKEVYISPDWYEKNGTPSCFCGIDFEYLRTEVLTKVV